MAGALQFRLTGGLYNTNPAASLGGGESATPVSMTPMNNIFLNVSPAQRENGVVTYCALSLHNNTGSVITAIKLYMSNETGNLATQLNFGVEIGTLQEIPDAETAPSSVSFAHYNTENKLALPNIAPGSSVRIWAQRIVQAGAMSDAEDIGAISVEYV